MEVFGRVDILVSLAGNPGGRRGPEVTLEEYEDLTSVHLRSTLLCNKHAVQVMVPTGGGAIVNFSSSAASLKRGQTDFTDLFRREGRNQLDHEVVRRPVWAAGHQGERAGLYAQYEESRYPAADRGAVGGPGRAGPGGDVGGTGPGRRVPGLERASFVTGVVVPLDGGWTARLA